MEVIIPKLEESGHDLNWYGGLLEMKVCDSVMFQYVPIGHGSPHVPKSHLKFLAIQLFINQDCWSSPFSGWSLWIPIWCLVLGCSFPHNDGWLVAWTPLKNMSSSVGIIIPNIWKKKSHVPNHQPVKIYQNLNPPLGTSLNPIVSNILWSLPVSSNRWCMWGSHTKVQGKLLVESGIPRPLWSSQFQLKPTTIINHHQPS